MIFKRVFLFQINISHSLYSDWSINRKINERQAYVDKWNKH